MVCVSSSQPAELPPPKEEEMACLWNVTVCTQVTYLEPKVREREVGATESGLDQQSASLCLFTVPLPAASLTWTTSKPIRGISCLPPRSEGFPPHKGFRLLCLAVTVEERWRGLLRERWLAFLAVRTFPIPEASRSGDRTSGPKCLGYLVWKITVQLQKTHTLQNP